MKNFETYDIIKKLDEICKNTLISEPFRFEWLPEPVFSDETNQYFFYKIAKRKIKYPYCIHNFNSSIDPDYFRVYYQIPRTATDLSVSRIIFEFPTFEIFTMKDILRQGTPSLFMKSVSPGMALNINFYDENQNFEHEANSYIYIERFETLNYYESLEGDYIARNIKTLEWHNDHIDTVVKLDPSVLKNILMHLKQQYHPELLNFKDMAWLI